MVTDPKRKARRDLKSLLGKFGIKSATQSNFEETLDEMLQNTLTSFGTPDEIFMSSSAFETFMKAFHGEKK